MSERRLSEEDIERIARREWNKPKTKKVKFTVNENGEIEIDETKIAKIMNLSGPKTVEGKKNSLRNLRPGVASVRHGGYVKRILDEEELDFYNQRREKYLQEYDLNTSADEILLHLVLIDEVIIFRLLKALYEKPSAIDRISRPLEEAQKRLHKNLDGLAMLRKQRINQDRMDKQMSIVRLANEVMKNKDLIKKQMELEELEDLEFLKKKKERELQIIDVDSYDVDKEAGGDDGEEENKD